MAAYLNGLDTDETVALTTAMMSSGTMRSRSAESVASTSTRRAA